MKKELKKQISEDENNENENEKKDQKHSSLGYQLRNYDDCYFKIYKRTRLNKEF